MRARAISKSSDFCIIEACRDDREDGDGEIADGDDRLSTNAVLLTMLWGGTVVTTRTLRRSTSAPLDAFGMMLEDAPTFDIAIGRCGAIVYTPAGEPIPSATRMRVRVTCETSRLVVVAEPIFERRRGVGDFWPDSRTASLAVIMLLAFPLLSFLMTLRSPKAADDYDAQLERMQYAREMLTAAMERDPQARDDILEKLSVQEDTRGIGQERSGTSGARRSSEEGSAGDPGSTKATSLMRQATRTQEALRAEEIEHAKDFGMISLVAHGVDAAHTAVAFASVDQDATHGGLRGDAWDDSFGAGSTGLSGVGEGGGGKGAGVGLSSIGGLGLGTIEGPLAGGAGALSGTCDGACAGRVGGAHRTRFVYLRCDDDCSGLKIGGRLPPEAIQRVIRQNFGAFRGCYETGLKSNPSLEGRVAVKFVIDREGAVAVAEAGESTTMTSAQVTGCVVAQMMRISFPRPEGGIVTVVYPLMFEHA